ncbi:MAG: curli-like amyloid fiber formation chaperone CsgH [Pseudomonadota bacterium]
MTMTQSAMSQPGTGGEPACRIWIEAQPEGASLRITVRAWSEQTARLDYELLSEKRDGTNRSRSRQAGGVTLESGKSRILSSIKLDKLPTAHYTFSAKLYRDGIPVAGQETEY